MWGGSEVPFHVVLRSQHEWSEICKRQRGLSNVKLVATEIFGGFDIAFSAFLKASKMFSSSGVF